MSTLRVNNITDTSGGSSNLSVPGAAEAWVNFNGTGTVAIRAQLNVSSITDNGVGDYTINFASALTDANYSFCLNGQQPTASSSTGVIGSVSAAPTASALRINSFNSSNYTDYSYITATIHR